MDLTHLLWILVGGTEKNPLLSGRHLRTSRGRAFILQLDTNQIELHTELPQMLILPDKLILLLWRLQYGIDFGVVLLNQLLDELLDCKSALHVF